MSSNAKQRDKYMYMYTEQVPFEKMQGGIRQQHQQFFDGFSLEIPGVAKHSNVSGTSPYSFVCATCLQHCSFRRMSFATFPSTPTGFPSLVKYRQQSEVLPIFRSYNSRSAPVGYILSFRPRWSLFFNSPPHALVLTGSELQLRDRVAGCSLMSSSRCQSAVMFCVCRRAEADICGAILVPPLAPPAAAAPLNVFSQAPHATPRPGREFIGFVKLAGRERTLEGNYKVPNATCQMETHSGFREPALQERKRKLQRYLFGHGSVSAKLGTNDVGGFKWPHRLDDSFSNNDESMILSIVSYLQHAIATP
ncbi:hypothetical protein K432DRAFT_458643 [Lepidopterella palustris CBS 459.81]|uniref:Uncharacterized protein n=1 Tax=Lepidopterella palustris CBS 459.81 TaxID=1314670 RepID=A0A8E2EIZ9_9PEZI|nr:hypothetical protein K432DRAFT_458643 [Lepidopterella palustris CBS 459.81]